MGIVVYACQITDDFSDSLEGVHATVCMLITAGMLMQEEWHFNG
jgi:hypothetical protein